MNSKVCLHECRTYHSLVLDAFVDLALAQNMLNVVFLPMLFPSTVKAVNLRVWNEIM